MTLANTTDTARLAAALVEAHAEIERLRAANTALFDLLKHGLTAAQKIERAHGIITHVDAERAVHDWCNAVRTALRNARAALKEPTP